MSSTKLRLQIIHIFWDRVPTNLLRMKLLAILIQINP